MEKNKSKNLSKSLIERLKPNNTATVIFCALLLFFMALNIFIFKEYSVASWQGIALLFFVTAQNYRDRLYQAVKLLDASDRLMDKMLVGLKKASGMGTSDNKFTIENDNN